MNGWLLLLLLFAAWTLSLITEAIETSYKKKLGRRKSEERVKFFPLLPLAPLVALVLRS